MTESTSLSVLDWFLPSSSLLVTEIGSLSVFILTASGFSLALELLVCCFAEETRVMTGLVPWNVELDLMVNVLFDEDDFGVQMVTLMGANFPIRLAGVT